MSNKASPVLGNITGAVVVIGCMSIASALVYLLCIQLSDLNKEPHTIALKTISTLDLSYLSNEQRRETILFSLENDAQHLRTRRSQSLVGARLYIQSIALLAGISLLVMGSSFVFARIRTTPTEIASENILYGKLSVRAYSPGLILAFLGTALIGYTLYISIQEGASIKTGDASVFFLQDGRASLPQSEYINPDNTIDYDKLSADRCTENADSAYCKAKERAK